MQIDIFSCFPCVGRTPFLFALVSVIKKFTLNTDYASHLFFCHKHNKLKICKESKGGFRKCEVNSCDEKQPHRAASEAAVIQSVIILTFSL